MCRSIRYVSYTGLSVRTIVDDTSGPIVYLTDWLEANRFPSKEELINLEATLEKVEEEWEKVECNFERWCEEAQVTGIYV